MAVLIEERKQKRFTVGPMCPNPYPAHMHDPVETVIVRKGYINMTVNNVSYLLEPNTVMIVLYLAVMLNYSWKLTLVGLVTVALNVSAPPDAPS